MLAQHLAQPRMQQMRSGVIPHGSFANLRVHDRVDFVADAKRLFGDHLMCTHTLHRRIVSLHFRDDRIVFVRIKPSPIPTWPPDSA